jgi:hypothetical protein
MLNTRKRQPNLAANVAGAVARVGAVLHNAGRPGMAWRIVPSAILGSTPQ